MTTWVIAPLLSLLVVEVAVNPSQPITTDNKNAKVKKIIMTSQEEKKNLNINRLKRPTRKPPVHFGPKTEGISPEEAKRIIERRKVSSNIVFPSVNKEVSDNG